MLNDIKQRLLVGVPLAGVLAGGLIGVMNSLIEVDEIDLTPPPERKLEAITAQIKTPETHPDHAPPEKLDPTVSPPPPPKLSVRKSDIDLPAPTLQGAAPKESGFAKLTSLKIDIVTVPDTDARPFVKPNPTYPTRLQARGIEGDCEVRFDVDLRGRPYNLVADCSHQGFQREAIKAVSKAEFAPKIVRGRPVERKNVIYPLVFSLN